MNNKDISIILKPLSPGKRVKYIRQKLLNQNQNVFCKDGLVRSGTLKSIEIERMKIGPKIAERLSHKLALEGIICEASVFLDANDACTIQVDESKKELSGNSTDCLEEIRKKLTLLTPIKIVTNEFSPQIPEGATLLSTLASKENLKQLNNTLCFIKGDKSSLYYLTYLKKGEMSAEINNKKTVISTNIIDFCSIYMVEIIYFGNKLIT